MVSLVPTLSRCFRLKACIVSEPKVPLAEKVSATLIGARRNMRVARFASSQFSVAIGRTTISS